MPQVTVTLDQVGQLAGEVLDGAVAEVVSSLALAAGQLAERATRLDQAAARLKGQPDADPEEVAALEQAAAQAAVLNGAVQPLATREPTRPRITPDGWLVFGRALQPDGQPATGVRVGVAADDGKLTGLPSDEPDGSGDFSVTYRREHFPDPPEEPPEVFVVAEDENGDLRAQSGTTVRFQAGRAEYVELTVSPEPRKKARKAKRTTKPTAARKATKPTGASRPARPTRRRGGKASS